MQLGLKHCRELIKDRASPLPMTRWPAIMVYMALEFHRSSSCDLLFVGVVYSYQLPHPTTGALSTIRK